MIILIGNIAKENNINNYQCCHNLNIYNKYYKNYSQLINCSNLDNLLKLEAKKSISLNFF